MRNIFALFGLALLVGSFYFVVQAESFIKPKKRTRKPSVSKIRENIADEYAEVQQEVAQLLKQSGHLLGFVVDDVRDILEENKEAFFAKAGAEKLKEFYEKLCAFKNFLREYHSKFEEQTNILKSKLI